MKYFKRSWCLICLPIDQSFSPDTLFYVFHLHDSTIACNHGHKSLTSEKRHTTLTTGLSDHHYFQNDHWPFYLVDDQYWPLQPVNHPATMQIHYESLTSHLNVLSLTPKINQIWISLLTIFIDFYQKIDHFAVSQFAKGNEYQVIIWKKNQICTLSHGHFNPLNAGSQVQETNFILLTSYQKYLHFALPFWISHERYFLVSTNMPRIDPWVIKSFK